MNSAKGTFPCSLTPILVSGITDAIAVSSGWAHSCALLKGGSVRCWGRDTAGELGSNATVTCADAVRSGSPPCSVTPVSVSGITNATAVAAGSQHTCILLAEGTIQCWGDNTSGALGNGTVTSSVTPVSVSGITNATAVAASSHNCAVLGDGTLQCWGDPTNRPSPVSGITNCIAVAPSGAYTCALLSAGSVQCWGSNTYGSLGDGTTTSSSTPVTVVGF